MTVEEEKVELKRRLAELEEGERRELEGLVRSRRGELDRVREDYRSRREVAQAEIHRLEQHLQTLEVRSYCSWCMCDTLLPG